MQQSADSRAVAESLPGVNQSHSTTPSPLLPPSTNTLFGQQQAKKDDIPPINNGCAQPPTCPSKLWGPPPPAVYSTPNTLQESVEGATTTAIPNIHTRNNYPTSNGVYGGGDASDVFTYTGLVVSTTYNGMYIFTDSSPNQEIFLPAHMAAARRKHGFGGFGRTWKFFKNL